jgi:hypothetical protein
MGPEVSGPHPWTNMPAQSTPTVRYPSGPPPLSIPLFVNAAYYPNWSVYKKHTPSSLRLGFVSHIFYAFAWYLTLSVSLSVV